MENQLRFGDRVRTTREYDHTPGGIVTWAYRDQFDREVVVVCWPRRGNVTYHGGEIAHWLERE